MRVFAQQKSPIKSVQRGTTFLHTLTAQIDVTIAAVDPSKTTVSYLGENQIDNHNAGTCTLQLLNATTLRLDQQYGNYQTRVSWEVIEYV